MKTRSYVVVLTLVVAVLSMKEQVVNVPEPSLMNTAPPLCSKMIQETKERDRRSVDIYKENIVWDDSYERRRDDCRVNEKKKEEKNDSSVASKKYFDIKMSNIKYREMKYFL
jgi:hypothetical protein